MSREYLKINEEAYDKAAEEYGQRLEHYKEKDKEVVEPFIQMLRERFGKPRVLELGPGSGLALRYFEESGFETFAIEISQNMIDIAQQVSPKTNFFKGDFLSYDFKDRKFDGIFGKAFIHLFPKEDAILVLEKIKALLSEKGITYLTTTIHLEPSENFLSKEDYGDKPKRFRKHWTEDEFAETLEECGFEIVFKKKTNEKVYNKEWITFIAQTKF